MGGCIYLIQDGDKLIEMTEQEYDSEDLLQELLAKYPSLLAGDQINNNSPRKWLLISRETPLKTEEGDNFSVDHLFLDQDAIPTIVEVKRSSDIRIRREVLGQMLDYAANAALYWPVEQIRALFQANCQAQSLNSEQKLDEFLGNVDKHEEFWKEVKTNIQAGRIRMLFVADEIPSGLRRVIEFLNVQMDPAEVLGIEIKQYISENLKTLVPRVIGQTEEAQQKKSSINRVSKQWDEESFFEVLKDNQGDAEAEVAKNILKWAKTSMEKISWGKGKEIGSFQPILSHNGNDFKLIVCWTNGFVEILFQYILENPPFNDEEKRKESRSRLNEISGVQLPLDAI